MRSGVSSSELINTGNMMLRQIFSLYSLTPNKISMGRLYSLHRKKKVREFPVPSRDVTTKLSLGGNNVVITELFLPREFG
jgi:hypothetical protein